MPLHAVQIEHGRADALGDLLHQAQRGTLALAQVELPLRVLVESRRQQHYGHRLAQRLRLALVGANHAGQTHVVGIAHVDAPVQARRTRIDGDRLLRGERQHRRRHLQRVDTALGQSHDIRHLRGRGRAHVRRLTPVFDVAVVLGFAIAAHRRDHADGEQRQSGEDYCDPQGHAHAGRSGLLLPPRDFLLAFGLLQLRQVRAAGLLAHPRGIALPPSGRRLDGGGVVGRHHVEILPGANIGRTETQRAVVHPGGFGDTGVVQPCPAAGGVDAVGEAHNSGDLADGDQVAVAERLPLPRCHVLVERGAAVERHRHVELETAGFFGRRDVPADLHVFRPPRGRVVADLVPVLGGIERLGVLGPVGHVRDVPVPGVFAVP